MYISSTTAACSLRHGSDTMAVRALTRAGFDACDFSMFHYPLEGGVFDLSPDRFDSYFLEIREVAKACGMNIWQAHAPFPSMVGEPREDARRLAALRRSVRAAALLECRFLVIHGDIHFLDTTEEEHAQLYENSLTLYRELRPDLQREGVRACIENVFGWDEKAGRARKTAMSTAEEIVEALEALDGENFCACMDIGHARLTGQDPGDMIRTLGRWLRVLHVHDNDARSDQHLLPFLGGTDWKAVCAALRKAEYPGVISLEADTFLTQFPAEMEGTVLRLMAETANTLAERVVML